MANSDLLYDIFKSPLAATLAVPAGLGLGVGKVAEDVRDQVDGADAIDVVRLTWAPALNGDQESAKLRADRGKPAMRSRIFAVRGNRPVDVETVLLRPRPKARLVDGAGGAVEPVAIASEGGGLLPAESLFGGGEAAPAAGELDAALKAGREGLTAFPSMPSYFERGR